MNCKKWIVAQDAAQMDAIGKVHEFAQSIDVPTRFLTDREIKEREPDVRAEAGVLESESTGIVDSHALMSFLEGDFQNRGGECAFRTEVKAVETIDGGKGGYKIHTRDDEGGAYEFTADTLVNSAGLFAVAVNNMVFAQEQERQRTPFYAKGTYFSYSASHPKPKTLLYPAPVVGLGGLGTHLTLDMAGRVRFGPDIEWVDDPTDYRPNPSRLHEAVEMIKTYLPGVQEDAINLDYCGIRPKLGKLAATSGKTFQDFVIQKEEGYQGFINLLAIESPGLTSCLAIGEMVDDLLYR